MSQCPVCGQKAGEHSSFCDKCGARLDGARPSTASDTMRDMTQEFDRAVRQHPDDTDARYQLALALMYDGQWGAAAQHLSEVVRLDSDFADAQANLAICLARLGQFDGAAEAIDAALALSPDRKRYQRLRDQITVLRGTAQ